jgi:Uma2 family endonuclease
MSTIAAPLRVRGDIVIGEQVRIPGWVSDHESYRRWACSDHFPERGWFSYLNGELWVDLSMERLGHNQIKGEFAVAVSGLARASRHGRYIHDRMLLTHVEAGLSTEPDGAFVSFESLRSGLVVLKKGGDSLEMLGSPDMTLEVVSATSVYKDLELLPDLYWKAGVREYWLVDPRDGTLRFDILRHAKKGYVATRKRAGWVKSAVFGTSFRLTQSTDEQGLPEFRLEIR